MNYYDDEENVRQYIDMAAGSDGSLLVDKLRDHIKAGSKVLELGMGPGMDLDLLAKVYQTTGSDSSTAFLDLCRNKNPQADLLWLDAKRIETDRVFDCIYSNKVLQHLSKDELKASFRRQAEVLRSDGIVLHSFWYGDQEAEEYHGLMSYYYTESDLLECAGDLFEVIELERYGEFEDGDSIYLISRKIGGSL